MRTKNLKISTLLDYYGELLTEKQKDLLELYYNEDLSLGEIAELKGITRQGVRDAIKRGEAFLFELEEKLKLVEKMTDLLKMFEYIGAVATKAKGHFCSKEVVEYLDNITAVTDDYVNKNI